MPQNVKSRHFVNAFLACMDPLLIVLIPQGWMEAGANPIWHQERGRVHPGQVAICTAQMQG